MRHWWACFLFSAAANGGTQTSAMADLGALQQYEARASAVMGQVTRTRNAEPWAVSAGETVPIQQVISTGADGFAHFLLWGGGNFDIFANSRVAFRQNAGRVGDLLDVVSGRVRVEMRPWPGMGPQRVLTPSASITATQKAVIAVAIDEDGAIRIDVLEGEVRVRHTLLPRSEPTIVRAVDAILVRSDQQISRRLDRGSLYRYAIKPLHDLWTAVTPGRAAHDGEPVEGNRFLAATIKADGY